MTTEEGKKLAKERGAAGFYEISSILGEGVALMYMDAIRASFGRRLVLVFSS